MGHIDQLAEQIVETAGEEFAPKPERFTVSLRIDGMQLQYLDMLAERSGLKRSAMGNQILISGIMDLMDSLGVTEDCFSRLKPTEKYLEEREAA